MSRRLADCSGTSEDDALLALDTLGGLAVTEPAERGPKQLGRRAKQDDRSILAIALQWSSTVMTISIEMVVPGLLGYWADSRLGTGFLFLMLGMLFGVSLGIWQLVRLTQVESAKQLESGKQRPVDRSRDKPGDPR